MHTSNDKQWLSVLGFIILTVCSTTAYSDPIDDVLESGGAEARCMNAGDTVPTIMEDSSVASCSIPGDIEPLRASVDLPNGEAKVYSSSSGSGNPLDNLTPSSATTAFVELITVTDGWDDNGEARGTVELIVNGRVDAGIENQSSAAFDVQTWNSPPCYGDFCIPGGSNSAKVYFSQSPYNSPDSQETSVVSFGTGHSVIQSGIGPDLRATVTVPWTVTQTEPSFYIVIQTYASTYGFEPGIADFVTTSNLRGPPGFQYISRNGFAENLASLPPIAEGPVSLNGAVKTENGTDICAMVLASGQYMFSCNPGGQYELYDLPREPDGTVTRQVYADGFLPVVSVLPDSTTETVQMIPANNCRQYNPPTNPADSPGAAGKQHTISGHALLQNSQTPICAMVLANGSHVFSCDGSGSYSLEFPLDANGQFQLQVYADGFAPTIQTLDETSSGGDVRMARASECQ